MRGLIKRLRASVRMAARPDSGAMILRQSHFWSRSILWTIVLSTVAAVLWACLAHMDEVIHARGKLEPKGAVQEVQSPVSGVIAEILVKEGQLVAAGDVLVRLDQKVASAEFKAMQELAATLRAERDFYQKLFSRDASLPAPGTLPQEVLDLARSHAALLAESRLLRAIIETSMDSARLDTDQIELFTQEQKDRIENHERIRGQLEQAKLLELNSKKMYEAYAGLQDSRAASKVEVLARESAWIEAVARVKNLQVQLENIETTFRKDAMNRLSENTKRIAEVEAQLSKERLQNAQRLSEAEGRLENTRETLEHHEIRSPSKGIVFEIVSTKPGSVLAPKDVVLKIVPSEELIAKLEITNRDIGFVRQGQVADVEFDSFPKSEFGWIQGELIFVGSDVLPPEEGRPFYAFPAKVSLERQHLDIRGKKVQLQSGMAVSANIKVRKRRVINLFIDKLVGPVERMRELR